MRVTSGKALPALTELVFVQVIDADGVPQLQPFGVTDIGTRAVASERLRTRLVVPEVALPAELLTVIVKVRPVSP